MSTVNTEIRLLLNLWDLGSGQGLVKRSELLRPYKGKDKKAVYEVSLQELVDGGAIAQTDDKKVVKMSLTDAGLQKLSAGLYGEFGFEGQLVGSRLANAALKWFRQNQGQAVAVESATKISSYDEFKAVALETYAQLNRDYNFDNLVPIYRIRRTIDDRVTRSQFNSWMLEMQSKDILQLITGLVTDLTPDKELDSITTELGGLRYYAKLL
ncbi:MAG: hypothetical protein LH649_13660 [Pseudanabaena sp. CAN_BIN31]|nr:hypothetical protein [Pseudanabaena sp. CAN_BIN31]